MIKVTKLRSSAIALLLIPAVMTGQNILLKDDFSSRNRTNQNLPRQAQWFSAGPSEDLVVHSIHQDHFLTMVRNNNANRNTGALMHFAAPNRTVELLPGQTLKLRMQFTVNGAVDNDNSFWIGLYNSNNHRINSDNFIISNENTRAMQHPFFRNYSGYEASLNLGQSANATEIGSRLSRRPADHNRQRILSTGGNVGLGSASPEGMAGLQLLDQTKYTLEFIIEHQARGQIRTILNILGDGLPGIQSMSATDPRSVATAFDTLILWTSRHTSEAAFMDEFIIHEIEINGPR